MDTRAKLIICVPPKCASSTVKRIIAKPRGGKKNRYHTGGYMRKLGIKQLRTYSTGAIKLMITTYATVMLTRHPFLRLKSAYYDKFVYHQYYPREKRQEFISKYRSDKNNTVLKLIYEEFIRLSLDKGNVHWNTITSSCQPCYIKYNYIMHLESFGRDLPIFLKRFYNRTDKVGARHPGKYKHLRTNTPSIVIPEMTSLNKKEMAALVWKYVQDMELGGYGFIANTSVATGVDDCL